MIIKLYLLKTKNDIWALPNQIDGFKELGTTNFTFVSYLKPGGFINSTGMMQKYDFDSCILFARVDLSDFTIVQILEAFPADDLISEKEIERVKIENNKMVQQKTTELKYQIPSNLYIDETVWGLISTTVDEGLYPLLFGPKGCGKSETAIAVAKVTGKKFYPINCGAIFKPKQTLIGSMQAKEGSTYLVNSEFRRHFTSDEPTLIYLDEISRIPKQASDYMMLALDRLQAYLYVEEEGQRIYKGKNVTFMASGNFGFEYTDTRNLDGAFLDRFTKFIIDYLPEDQEIELLMKKVPKSIKTNITSLIRNANLCRAEVDKLRIGVSTRQLIDMAVILAAGWPLHQVIDHIFINLFVNGSMDERETVRQMLLSQG